VSRPRLAEWIALTLAVGISTALNLIVFGVVWAALFHQSDVNGGISENATQVLTGWGGGMIGVIGAYVGYKAASEANGGGAMHEETPQTEEQAAEEAPAQEETLPLEEPEAPAEEEATDDGEDAS